MQYDAKFVFSEIGYNFLPLEISAAFALEQLKRLEGFAATRRRHYASLLQFFKQYEEYFILPKQTEGADAVWLAFPVVIRDSAPFARKDIALFLETADIQTRPVFTGNVLKQPAFEKIPHRLAEGNARRPRSRMPSRTDRRTARLRQGANHHLHRNAHHNRITSLLQPTPQESSPGLFFLLHHKKIGASL